MINEHTVFLKLVALLYDIRYSGKSLNEQHVFIVEALEDAMNVSPEAAHLIFELSEDYKD